MTPSGVEKGRVSVEQLLEIDRDGSVAAGAGKASAETGSTSRSCAPAAPARCFHVHSVWNTILSAAPRRDGELAIAGSRCSRGWRGDHARARERVPISRTRRTCRGWRPSSTAPPARIRMPRRPRRRHGSTPGARASPRPSATSRWSSSCSRSLDAQQPGVSLKTILHLRDEHREITTPARSPRAWAQSASSTNAGPAIHRSRRRASPTRCCRLRDGDRHR